MIANAVNVVESRSLAIATLRACSAVFFCGHGASYAGACPGGGGLGDTKLFLQLRAARGLQLVWKAQIALFQCSSARIQPQDFSAQT